MSNYRVVHASVVPEGLKEAGRNQPGQYVYTSYRNVDEEAEEEKWINE